MTDTKPTVAFLGLGLMGARQARRLIEAGWPLVLWNRSREKAEALAPLGARVAGSAAAAAAEAEIVITMLENGPIVEDVVFAQGVAGAMRPGAVLIDMSSIKPAEAQDHAARLAEKGIAYLDAPVSGGTVGAEEGTLAIMVGGDETVFDRIARVFAPMGRATRVGPHGAGQLAKLANQIIVGVTIGAVAEALMLAARGGADPAKVREALRGGFAESRVLDLHGARMVERDFTTKGRSVTHLKDLDNALDAAERLGLAATPFTAATADLFRGLLANAGDLDHSGLLVELERRNPAN
ncbi:3-hydroxyisobutyrate dehydrogenase or related beta-hydroxyacid dehydrogenase [Chelatococcus sambhunathii]|uniref:3-hydroxyisobutyrate dehydrogenase or related beta-hydroxyacid dehydrogenase n=1 Tax=Chelatococcus sambhunathii TaxID=363953 RepID=A0ABM9U732_9HYPH|nr:NAD(P)-dependent oxidoreductase [Chelatococcus sambhunathii]CUA89412.1 3-hydroxyisobutyrate dehydrogenase or related beta-hydroxyacid dehydrogenase [Chelatococcus sambhunathii]